ncbi:MAG: serine hydrolase [Verrucomicrobia bacterium]|nr:serine hydrolase [Verrucomicrobiota bacterium]
MQRQPDIVRSLRNLRLNTDGTSQQNRMSLKPWNPIKSLIQFGFLLIFFCGPLETFGSTPVIPPSVQAAIRTRVDYGYNPGIIVGVVTESGRAYYSYGMISYESGSTPDEDTLFEIGSITKVFTATLLADMAARGEVSLNDAVQLLLPAGVTVPERSGRQIHLADLAEHASGLPNNPPFPETIDPLNPFADFAQEDLYDFLKSYRLPRSPGAQYEYSNLGIGLLGHALALRLGMPYEEALRDRVLSPLGLKDTSTTLTSKQETRRATGYSGVVRRPSFAMKVLAGAGALVSTAGDMLTFLEYQIGIRNTDLAPAISETQRPRRSAGSPEVSVGLCWITLSSGSIHIVFHDGATMGQTAFAGFDSRKRTGVVVLTNARVNNYSNVQDIGLNILESSIPLTQALRPADIALETKRDYVGRYEIAGGPSFEIGMLHDHLTLAFSEDRGAVFTLYPQSSRRFLLHEAGIEAAGVFNRNSEDEVVSLAWTQSGQTSTFPKKRIAPFLTAQFDSGEMRLSLKGNTNTDYVIEASEDLQNWSAISTNSIWDGPIVAALAVTSRARFYRAHEIE